MPFLITDTETKPDNKRILATCDWRGRLHGSEDEVAAQLLAEMCQNQVKTPDQCFTPARFHKPVAAVMLLVNDDLSYMHHAVLEDTDTKKLVTSFWGGYQWCRRERNATLVTFNGLSFDMPMMEVNGLVHGVDLSFWYEFDVKAWLDPRGPIAQTVHLDLYSFLAGKGRIGGDLNFWSRLFGLPGKLDSNGAMVSEMLAKQDGLAQVADYCICDTLNAYGVLCELLHCMGRAPHGWRKHMDDVAGKMAVGRGAEVKKFIDLVNADGLF
jgi:hypothetical protein